MSEKDAKRITRILLCVSALVVAAGAPSDAAGFTLAKYGGTEYRIVIPQDTDVSTKAVAEDFAAILKEMTGADFPVVTDDTEPGPGEIVVGATNARLVALGLAGMTQDFAEGECEVRTVGVKLVIAGGPLRGTINGMYGFLQDHLGCRWFTPGCMQMPKRATLEIGEIADRQKPAFVWRTQNAQMHWDAAWTARNRLNECKTYGGGVSMSMLMSDPRVATIGNYASGHAMGYIPGSLFETHPEYYSMIAGERVCPEDPNQRNYCMTNDGLAEYMGGVLKNQLRGSEGKRRFVGLGHPDNGNFCRCDVCQASYDVRGISGTYMAFDNKVTEMVVAQYPEAVVTTLAYGVSYPPPKDGMVMHPSLRVVWCPIGACYAHGFTECDANLDRHIAEDLAQWQATSSRLTIWHYTYQSDSLMPTPRMLAHAQDLRLYAGMNVQGVFGQDNPDSSRRTNRAFDGDKVMPAYGAAGKQGYFTVPFGLMHLRGYLFSRLLWDADFDWKDGVRDFCGNYYGPAGKALAEFALAVEDIDSYERTIGSTYKSYPGVHMSIGIAPKLKASSVAKMNALFEEALPAVEGDRTYRRRVELARASLDLAILCFEPAESALRKEAFDRFFALMEELGLKSIQRTPVGMESKSLAEFKEFMSHPDRLVIPGEEPIGANILVNSNFEAEIDGDGLPDSWQADGRYMPENYTVDPKGVSIVTSRAYSGQACVELTKSPAKNSIVALRQRFDAEPGKRYRATVRYQADLATGGVHIIFTAFDKDGKWLRHQGGARGVKTTGDRWATLAVDTTCGDDTAQLMIEFLFYPDAAEGRAWIDDFECAIVGDDE